MQDQDIRITPYTDLRSLGRDVLLTDADVAVLTRCAVATVKGWRKSGRVGVGPRFIPLGKGTLYRAGDVLDWLDARGRG